MDAGSKKDSSTSAKTPRQIEREKKRRPLREMIAKGKDAREATFVWIVNEILEAGIEPINFTLDPLPKELEEFNRCMMLSVLGQIRRIGAIISGYSDRSGNLSPKAWFYDPTFAEFLKELNDKEYEFEELPEKLQGILDRYPNLKSPRGFKKEWRELTDRLGDLLPKCLDASRMEYGTIGFVLGIHIAKREFAAQLDKVKLGIFEKFTIENPAVHDAYFDEGDEQETERLLKLIGK
jgi:hypothetical protein